MANIEKTYVIFQINNKNLIAPLEIPTQKVNLLIKCKTVKIDNKIVLIKDFYYDLNYPAVIINVEKVEDKIEL